MFKTDEITRAKLALVLVDVVGVPHDEITTDDLDALADACREQFVEFDPMTRGCLKDVCAVKLIPASQGGFPKGMMGVSMLLRGAGAPLEAVVPEEVALSMFNNITGRQVTDAAREMLKMYRPLEVALMKIGEAYRAMVDHKAEASVNGVLDSPVVQAKATYLAGELDKAYQDYKNAEQAQLRRRSKLTSVPK